jgi:ribosomal protein S18 acetylase RimI-like enzyme
MHDAATQIARAGLDDIDLLLALMHDFYAESGFALDRPPHDRAFRQLLANPALGAVWIARHKGAPAGHVVLAVRFTMEHAGLSGYVDDLYVRPQFRRLGIGRRLLDAVTSECRSRGCRSLQVEVASDNLPALALYAACGVHPLTDGRVLASGPL